MQPKNSLQSRSAWIMPVSSCVDTVMPSNPPWFELGPSSSDERMSMAALKQGWSAWDSCCNSQSNLWSKLNMNNRLYMLELKRYTPDHFRGCAGMIPTSALSHVYHVYITFHICNPAWFPSFALQPCIKVETRHGVATGTKATVPLSLRKAGGCALPPPVAGSLGGDGTCGWSGPCRGTGGRLCSNSANSSFSSSWKRGCPRGSGSTSHTESISWFPIASSWVSWFSWLSEQCADGFQSCTAKACLRSVFMALRVAIWERINSVYISIIRKAKRNIDHIASSITYILQLDLI